MFPPPTNTQLISNDLLMRALSTTIWCLTRALVLSLGSVVIGSKSLFNRETTIFPGASISLSALLFSFCLYLTPWLMERAISCTIFYFNTKGALNQMIPTLLIHTEEYLCNKVTSIEVKLKSCILRGRKQNKMNLKAFLFKIL